ncbi:hypothetical protein GO009_09060 [Muricauda sp. TY007]|uniref:hypothetical protein n=1 Tax=Allomuricauda sp. TY007 TaxID=2683200 RepID=UPI0013BFA507|nr:MULTISPECIES: hypothetical protein [unclassified Allomuricauda]MBA4746497.1 hypothetical protein [Allomuricauda sp.]NDV16173.1 hypothetical protein [Muricauda sp. TY007]
MTVFLSILFVLLTINAVLLIFSVNGAKERFTKPMQRISENSTTKLFPREAVETEYKEAV